ncbi:MAG TPA: PepSY-like domain-containing protein [Saprospiraceae bacterium]|nr:PepSY-like domain-containing protein [Saprospiraceae bacterium]
MARFIFVLILFCGMNTVFSQGKATGLTPVAPDAVLKGFIKNYGDEKVTWKVNEGNYEATFKLIGMPATAWFDSTGHRMNVVVEIKADQLPSIALSYIERNYPKAKITKALKWTDDKKVNTFQAEIKVSAESKNLLFNARGNFIKEPGEE